MTSKREGLDAWGLIRRIPFRFIGIGMFAYLLYWVGPSNVAAQFDRVGALNLAYAFAAITALVVFRCGRWLVLSRALGAKAATLRIALDCNESIWLGIITPGRVGEFRRAFSLAQDTGRGLAVTSALVVFDLLLDLSVYASLALVGVTLVAFGGSLARPLVFSFYVTAGVLALLVLPRILRVVGFFLPAIDTIPGAGIVRQTLVQNLGGWRAAWLAVASWAAALAYALSLSVLVSPMALGLGFADIVVIIGLAGVAGAIPITYFGLGTRDVAMIWYFAHIGLGADKAVAVSVTFLFIQLIGVAVCLALAAVAGMLRPRTITHD